MHCITGQSFITIQVVHIYNICMVSMRPKLRHPELAILIHYNYNHMSLNTYEFSIVTTDTVSPDLLH